MILGQMNLIANSKFIFLYANLVNSWDEMMVNPGTKDDGRVQRKLIIVGFPFLGSAVCCSYSCLSDGFILLVGLIIF